MRVDFYKHQLAPADAEAVAAVLGTRFLTTGEVAKAVEARLSIYFGVAHVALTNSWTNGALAVLLAMDIGDGDEVIVPAMTFIATANVVELAGARPVFADVDAATLLLTPELAAKHVTNRTKAVIPVHLYGQMCDVSGLRRMLDRHPASSGHVRIIEDAAHCFEGERAGVKPGRMSDAAIFSFYATKNVTCGEGGAVITRDLGLYEAVIETRLHGMSAGAADRFAGGQYSHWDMKRLGVKANLPDLLAALLPRQIDMADPRLVERQEIANHYREALAGGPLRLVKQLSPCKSAEHLFTLGVPAGQRDAALAALGAAGVGVTVNYRAVCDTTYYRQRYPTDRLACPVALRWGEETLTLPLYPGLGRAEQDYVSDVVRSRIYPLVEKAAQDR